MNKGCVFVRRRVRVSVRVRAYVGQVQALAVYNLQFTITLPSRFPTLYSQAHPRA